MLIRARCYLGFGFNIEQVKEILQKESIEKIDDFSGAINLGIGKGYSVEEIIKAAELVTGKKCKIVYTDRRKGDAAELYANNKLARNVLNWNPKYLSIENIIETAWKWENNRKY